MINNEILEQLKTIQNSLIEYMESGSNAEEHFQNLQKISKNQIISEKYLILILHLIAQIASNHHRENNFLPKIEQAILLFKEKTKQNLNNSSIFTIFKDNKRILLFLIKEGMITIDIYISSEIFTGNFINYKYPQYFFPEIKPFLYIFNDLQINIDENNEYYDSIKEFEEFKKRYSEKLPEDYEERRLIGENDDFICNLIRNDLIDEFISYINQRNIEVNQEIDISIYETNNFLLKKMKKKLT